MHVRTAAKSSLETIEGQPLNSAVVEGETGAVETYWPEAVYGGTQESPVWTWEIVFRDAKPGKGFVIPRLNQVIIFSGYPPFAGRTETAAVELEDVSAAPAGYVRYKHRLRWPYEEICEKEVVLGFAIEDEAGGTLINEGITTRTRMACPV